jgi:hypothetical protein
MTSVLRAWSRENGSLIGSAVTVFVFLVAALRSWRAWGDPVIDFPAQLYTAWRLAEGEVLYRDLLHYYGPLSQVLNGALFRIFAPGYLVLTLANLLIALTIALVVQRSISKWFDPLTGLVAGVTFLLLHAFQNLGTTSAFSFIAPYSHEATHGTLLLIILIVASIAVGLESRLRAWAGLGLIAGLCWLTKPEFLVAASGILLLQGTIETARRHSDRRRLAIRAAAATLAGMILPLIAAFAYFSVLTRADVGGSARATFGSIYPLLTARLTDNVIYQRVLGTDRLDEHLKQMAVAVLAFSAVLVVALAIDLLASSRLRRGLGVGYLLAVGILLSVIPLLPLSRAWPPLATAGAIAVFGFLVRGMMSPAQGKAALLLAVAALVLCLKAYFHATFWWLGFYLMMPATIFITILCICILPAVLRRKVPGAFVLRWAAAVLLLSIAVQAARLSAANYDLRTLDLGEGVDRMYVRPDRGFPVPGIAVREIVERVDRLTPPGSTLIAIPEGTLVNYLLRRPNPTPFTTNFIARPLFEAWGGEAAVLEGLEASPPDYVLYLRRPAEMPGPDYEMRGERGFANGVFAWVEENYEEIDRIGPETTDFTRLGYVLFRRR